MAPGGSYHHNCTCPRCGYTGTMVSYSTNYGTQSTLTYGGYSNSPLYAYPPPVRLMRLPKFRADRLPIPAVLELRRIIEIEEPAPEPRIPTARRAGCRARGRRPIRSLPGCRR